LLCSTAFVHSRFHASISGGDQLHLVGRLPKRTTSRRATKHNSLGTWRWRPSPHHSRSCRGACILRASSSSTHLNMPASFLHTLPTRTVR
jgi:hypothetical protein